MFSILGSYVWYTGIIDFGKVQLFSLQQRNLLGANRVVVAKMVASLLFYNNIVGLLTMTLSINCDNYTDIFSVYFISQMQRYINRNTYVSCS